MSFNAFERDNTAHLSKVCLSVSIPQFLQLQDNNGCKRRQMKFLKSGLILGAFHSNVASQRIVACIRRKDLRIFLGQPDWHVMGQQNGRQYFLP